MNSGEYKSGKKTCPLMYLLLVDRIYKYYSQAKVAPHILGVSVIVPEAKGNHGRRNTRISTPRNLSPEDSLIHINLSSKTRVIEIREAADFDNHG